jgi:hypothetical protein
MTMIPNIALIHYLVFHIAISQISAGKLLPALGYLLPAAVFVGVILTTVYTSVLYMRMEHE